MRICWPVAAAEAMHNTNNFSARLQSCLYERPVDQVRHHRIGGDEHMGARDEHGEQSLTEPPEEIPECHFVSVAQDRESGQRSSLGAVVGRWDPPHTAPSALHLVEF